MPSKQKPKATKPKDDAKAQSERFIETARMLGVDETGKAFDEAVGKILKARQPTS
jgi:hypothetical protein